MPVFGTPLSALNANQRLIDLIGHNIANANTPGYHRQVADLASRWFGQEIGMGVEIKQIRRISDSVLQSAVRVNSSENEALSAQINSLRQIQTYLNPGDGSVDKLLGQFFDQIEQSTFQPADPVQLRLMLNAAGSLTDALRSLAENLLRHSNDLDARGRQLADQINNLTSAIADLNGPIAQLEIQGKHANDLRDQRGRLLDQLASLVDVRTTELKGGVINVIAGNMPLVIDQKSTPLVYKIDTDNNANLVVQGSEKNVVRATGGTTAGLIQMRNEDLPGLLGQIEQFTRDLIRRFDTIHATGMNQFGPMQLSAGHRAVTDAAAPLDQAGLGIPPNAGSLFISVTNQTTGDRTLHEVAIDPATQSLQDVAAAISTIANIQAVVDSQRNTLTILAGPDYAFDFAGRLPTVLDTSGVSGSTNPQVGGVYIGAANDNYSFHVIGSGTIGVTSNLSLEVRDGGGNVLDSLNIGAGYEPDSALTTVNGVSVRLSSGTANAGDTFAVDVIAQPDTAGILTALGLNTFFEGENANTIAVRQELLGSPELINSGRSEFSDDNANLLRFADLRDAAFFGQQTQSYEEYYLGIVGEVGGRVQNLSQQHAAKDEAGLQLQDQLQGIVGVDPNEEIVRLLEFQRAYQVSARYLTVINETLDELVNIIR